MCQNYPNCNCPSCTQCQDCTQVTPTWVTTTTGPCTPEFTEECPNGLQSTDCLVYTGDTLKDCENNDFLFRGTKFNTFLSQLWETVKCAATATTDTIDYTGAAIKTCDNNTTIVPTNTPVTTALNNIWNHIKCWNSSLTTLINDRQPVWKAGYPIFVGPTLSAPFNNINTAITEITKYHHDVTGPVGIRLSDGSHSLNTVTLGNWNSQSGSFQIECNAPLSATLSLPNGLTIDSFNLILRNISTKGAITVTNRGQLLSNNCNHVSLENTTNLITVSNSSSVTFLESTLFGNFTGPLTPRGILVENNSSVNIITTQRQNEFFANFTTLFDVTDNSSLFLKKNAITQSTGTRIGTVLNLNNNSKASIVGSTSEFFGPTPLLSSYIAFNIKNNSELYLENIKISGYSLPFNIENNSKVIFGGIINSSSVARINVLNNSSFIGNPGSILNANMNNIGEAFVINENSTVNLLNTTATFTNVTIPTYSIRKNSICMFKLGSITPVPSSGGNSAWGDGSTSVVINNIVNTSTNINSIGCGYLIFP
jgi:hypothetical protein